MVYGPYAEVDYNLTLCPLQSRLQHIYYGQPYARIELSPMPESTTLSPRQGLWIWPQLRKRQAVRGEALLYARPQPTIQQASE